MYYFEIALREKTQQKTPLRIERLKKQEFDEANSLLEPPFRTEALGSQA